MTEGRKKEKRNFPALLIITGAVIVSVYFEFLFRTKRHYSIA